MSNCDNAGRTKLIANPGAGNGANASARLEQVHRFLVEHGMKVGVALAKGNLNHG